MTIARQTSPLPSQTGPTSARSTNGAEVKLIKFSFEANQCLSKNVVEEYKSMTARSNTSNTTAMSTSARSVSFKEPVADEDQDSSSSKTSVLTAKPTSVLDKLGMSL